MSNRFVEWLTEQVGEQGRWKSPRQLSLAAGLNQNQIGLLLTGRKPEPETVKKLARATDANLVSLYLMLGWLDPTDVEGPIPSGGAEAELLRAYRDSPEHLRGDIEGVADAAAEIGRRQQRVSEAGLWGRPASRVRA